MSSPESGLSLHPAASILECMYHRRKTEPRFTHQSDRVKFLKNLFDHLDSEYGSKWRPFDLNGIFRGWIAKPRRQLGLVIATTFYHSGALSDTYYSCKHDSGPGVVCKCSWLTIALYNCTVLMYVIKVMHSGECSAATRSSSRGYIKEMVIRAFI